MKHAVYKHKNGYLKKYTGPIIGIILIVLLMAAIRFFNSSQSNSVIQEELPIPKIKEQGAPELIKLNPDSQIKEGW